jgi:uncharacterized protein with GYD domain
MPKYLLIASYTAEGAKGVLKDGGTARRDAAAKAIQSVGAQMDGFYFAFGSGDAYVIIDAPDHASAAAISLAVASSGAVGTETIVLIDPSEIDAAAQKAGTLDYRPPGS